MPKAKKPAPRRKATPRKRAHVQEVVDETIALFRWLSWVSEQLYGDDARGAARRWVLRRLHREGAQTVPTLARGRKLKRQSMQPVVDGLVADGLARWKTNPSHARSRLAELTARGRRLVEGLDATDGRVLSAVSRDVTQSDLQCTAQTLRTLRTAFELEARWRRVLEGR